jgi:hypothetical protein
MVLMLVPVGQTAKFRGDIDISISIMEFILQLLLVNIHYIPIKNKDRIVSKMGFLF